MKTTTLSLLANRFHVRSALTLMSALFVAVGALASPGAASAATNVGGTIGADTTWTAANSPYVASSFTVAAGKTLTIEAGTVVKFQPGSIAYVYGTVRATGSAAGKVVFTSVKDDDADGNDTGGDGPTPPGAGNWTYFRVYAGGFVDLANASVRYAGASDNWLYPKAAILVVGGTVSATDTSFTGQPRAAYQLIAASSSSFTRCDFAGGTEGIVSTEGSLFVADSAFAGQSGSGFSSSAGWASVTGSTFAGIGGSAGWLSAAVGFTHSGNAASGGPAVGFVIEGSQGPASVTWNADLPYVTHGYGVPAGKALSVGPGAAVKFADAGSTLNVEGALAVAGTADAPACFSSLRDDACGGDTNGDGGATSAYAGAWRQVTVYGTADVSHASFSWGGSLTGSVSSNATLGSCLRSVGQVTVSDSSFADCAVSNPGSGYGVTVAAGDFTAERTEFTRGLRGVWHIGGTATVRDSSFTAMSDYGVWSGPVGLNYVSYVPSAITITGSTFTVPPSSAGAVSLNAATPFVHSGNSATGRNAGFVIGGDVAAGSYWNADLPYVVGYVGVPSGRTLTVGPGAAVKFLENGSLSVGGTLDVAGTSSSPVCFTSVKDDSCGGDSDGVAAQPAAADWSQVNAYGTANFSHASFSWGGRLTGSVSSNATLGSCLRSVGQVTVSDSTFADCAVSNPGSGYAVTVAAGDFTAERTVFTRGLRGVWHIGGTATVRDSSFTAMSDYGVWSGPVGLNYVSYVPSTLTVTGTSFTVPVSSQGAVSLNASVPFVHSGNSAAGRNAGFTVGGSLAPGQIWNADLPYLVGYAVVPSGAALTVGPGAAVKFLDGGTLDVAGSLDVAGTDAAPVCFTSVKDDACGGDTNGDGATTSPSAVDWSQINAYGTLTASHASFSWGGRLTGSVSSNATLGSCLRSAGHVTVSDSSFSDCARTQAGNGYAVTVAAGDFTAERTEFTRGLRGVWHIGGTATVRDSSFSSMSDYGIWSGPVGLNYVSYVPVSLAVTGSAFSGGLGGAYLAVASASIGGSSFSGASGTAVVVTGSSAATVTDSTIANNANGLLLSAGSLAVHNSSITGNTTYAARNTNAALTLDAAGNWWGSASGPYVVPAGQSSSVPNRVSQYVNVSGPLAHDPVVPTPAVTSLAQALDGGAPIDPATGATDGREAVLSGAVTSPAGRLVRLEVEVRPFGIPFSGAATLSEILGASGAVNSVHLGLLADGQYHWQARAVDQAGIASAWVEYQRLGHESEYDFEVASMPSVSDAGQFRMDDATAIAAGDTTDEKRVMLKASVSSQAAGRALKAQFQVLKESIPFTDETTGIIWSDEVVSGASPIIVSAQTDEMLTMDEWHWRVRAVDVASNDATDWLAQDDAQFSTPKHVRIAVVMVEPHGLPHESVSMYDRPCKLDDKPTRQYVLGRNQEYFDDLSYCVSDYYLDQSYGKVKLDFEFPIVGWREVPDGGKTETYYAADSTGATLLNDSFMQSGFNSNQYEIIVIIHSGGMYESVLGGTSKIRTASVENRVTVSEIGEMGSWVHEIGHVLGYIMRQDQHPTPDLYGTIGNVGPWDVMANGDSNGPSIFSMRKDPSSMSTFSRVFLGWLTETRHAKTDFGEHPLNWLANSKYGDSVFRYELRDSLSDVNSDYYLMELRNAGWGAPAEGGTWDTSLPGMIPAHLVLYRVSLDPDGISPKTVVIPGYTADPDGNLFGDGILAAGDSYRDLNEMVKFHYVSSSPTVSPSQESVKISQIAEGSFEQKLFGAVLAIDRMLPIPKSITNPKSVDTVGDNHAKPNGMAAFSLSDYFKKIGRNSILFSIYGLIIWCLISVVNIRNSKGGTSKRVKKAIGLATLVIISLGIMSLMTGHVLLLLGYDSCGYSVWRGGAIFCQSRYNVNDLKVGQTLPNRLSDGTADFASPDLHLSCPDGRHVGLNYATGEFENQVDGSIVSGPMGGAPEWIYVPNVSANAGCSHYVSSYRVQQYLAAHPEVAAQVTDATETYELYARTIDPTAGIFTSATVAGSIEPGEEVVYSIAISGDGTPTVSEAPSDVDAPVITVASPLDGALTNASSVTVTGAALDAGFGLASVTANGTACALDGDDFTCAGVPLAEGPNEVAVTATDAAGNAASVTVHVSRDSVAPETSVDSAPTGWSASPEAVVDFSADEPGSSFLCSIDGAEAAPCFSPATLSGLADGPHSLSVAAVDPAGNADATPAVAEWLVDVTAPSASIASPATGTLTSSSSIVVNVDASDSGSGVASVAVGEVTCSASGAGLWNCATVPLAEGENVVAVTVTDAVGIATTASIYVTSDTVAPSASGAAASLASGSVAASVALTDAYGVAAADVTVRGPLPSAASAMSFAITLDVSIGVWFASVALPPQSAMPDGRYEVVIAAMDAAGNAASFAAGSFSLDRSSPEAPDVSVAPSVARPGVPVAVSVSASDASSGVASVSVRDAATGSVVSLALTAGDASFGTWTAALTAALPEGEHALEVTVTDAEGNATAASSSLSVDATAPSIAMTSIPPALTNSAAASVAFSSDDATAAFACSVDGAEPQPCASPFAVAALADGVHTVSVTATDPAGNSSAVAAASWTVDTAAPDTAITSGPAAASLTRSATVTLSATEPSSTFACSLDGAEPVACATPYHLSALADGPHLLSVTATDPAGNADATPAEWRWSVAAPVCPVLAASGAFSTTCVENPDGSTLVSLVGDKWRQAFALLLPFGASPAAPRATVAVTADDHNRNKPALSFLASLPTAAHAALTVPRGHASATYACVGAASLEIGPGCPGARVTIPAPGKSAAFATGRAISTSDDGASVTVTGY